jgi:aminoglycoside 3-N-acetyltransferase
MVVLVHSSLRSLGWVCGGAVAVVQALIDVVGPEGTIVVPTHTGENSEPSSWNSPPVPESWWPVIREHTPGFDPRVTTTRMMGIIPETLRTWPGALRSSHPAVSFAALGPRAEAIVGSHPIDFGMGDESPLGQLYRLGGFVLLLGVGFDRCTSFHLAEYQLPGQPEVIRSAPVLEDGRRVWRDYRDIPFDDDPFAELGAAYEATGRVTIGPIGGATARLFAQPPAVDFALEWLGSRRASG